MYLKKQSTMLKILQLANAQLDPLPKHNLAQRIDKQIRQLYAVFLASTLIDNAAVSSIQVEYFTLLLRSLNIDSDVSLYFERANQIDDQSVIDLIKALNSDGKSALIFDILMLLRISEPLSSNQVEMLSAVADTFSLHEDQITLASFWASKALGIEGDDFQDSTLYKKATKLGIKNKVKLISASQFNIMTMNQKYVEKNQIIAKGFVKKKKNYKEVLGGVYLMGSTFEELLEAINFEEISNIKSSNNGWLVKIKNPNSKNVASYFIIPLPPYLSNWNNFYLAIYS